MIISFDAGEVSDLVSRMFAQSTIAVDHVERESMVSDGRVVEFHLREQALTVNERALWDFVAGLAGHGGLPLGWSGEPVAYLLVAAFAARMRVPMSIGAGA